MPEAEFELKSSMLLIPKTTKSLEAFRLKIPISVKLFLVFYDDEVHAIELEDHEKPFLKVKSLNELKRVKFITPEDLEIYAEEAKNILESLVLT